MCGLLNIISNLCVFCSALSSSSLQPKGVSSDGQVSAPPYPVPNMPPPQARFPGQPVAAHPIPPGPPPGMQHTAGPPGTMFDRPQAPMPPAQLGPGMIPPRGVPPDGPIPLMHRPPGPPPPGGIFPPRGMPPRGQFMGPPPGRDGPGPMGPAGWDVPRGGLLPTPMGMRPPHGFQVRRRSFASSLHVLSLQWFCSFWCSLSRPASACSFCLLIYFFFARVLGRL